MTKVIALNRKQPNCFEADYKKCLVEYDFWCWYLLKTKGLHRLTEMDIYKAGSFFRVIERYEELLNMESSQEQRKNDLLVGYQEKIRESRCLKPEGPFTRRETIFKNMTADFERELMEERLSELTGAPIAKPNFPERDAKTTKAAVKWFESIMNRILKPELKVVSGFGKNKQPE